MQTCAMADMATNTTRLTLTGEIDIGARDELLAVIERVIRLGAATLIIDMEGVTFLDSSGVSALIRGRRLADAAGVYYRIANPQPIVRRMLELTGSLAYLTAAVGSDALAMS
jgi:anti-sigma B factor antagonist